MPTLRLLAIVLLPTTLAACSTAFSATDASLDPRVCESWQEIRPSRKDDKLSGETARQIAGNNVAREAWCNHPTKFASPNVRA